MWRAEIGTFKGHQGPVTAIAVSEGGRFLATTSTDDTVRIWCAPPWRDFAELLAHGRTILPADADEQLRRELIPGLD